MELTPYCAANRRFTTKMTKCWLFLFASLFVFFAKAQISYEKGYFVDNEGNRTNCLIRNVDWMKNPSRFSYKLTEVTDVKSADVTTVSEFGVGEVLKYVRATVMLDRTSDEIDRLTLVRKLNTKEETLFLKALIEGEASLYVYEEAGKRNYFFATNTSDIQLLRYKRYIKEGEKIAENNQYKQQLLNALTKFGVSKGEIEKLDYQQEKLMMLFEKTFASNRSGDKYFSSKERKDFFNFTLRPGLKNSSLTFQSPGGNGQSTEYDAQWSIRFGVEFEVLMPFNKNKWAIIAEPSYQYYTIKQSIRADDRVIGDVNYRTIEISLGARHYMFLNASSKIFMNATYVAGFSGNSRIDYTGGFTYPLLNSSNIALGAGYKFKDKYSVELNYGLNRFLTKDVFREAIYTNFSVILGYTLF